MKFGIKSIEQDSSFFAKGQGFSEADRLYVVMYSQTKSGSFVLNGREVDVPPYTLVFVSPGQELQVAQREDSEVLLLYFSKLFFERTSGDINVISHTSVFRDEKGYVSISLSETYISYVVFTQYLLSFSQERYHEALYQELAHTLVKQVVLFGSLLMGDTKKVAVGASVNSDVLLINRFRELLEKHHAEQKQVAFYAPLLGVTAKKLAQASKKVLKKTPKEMVMDMLILSAKKNLIYSDKEIKEIASELGFSDWNNFSAGFKKQTGMTPTDYRKRHVSRQFI